MAFASLSSANFFGKTEMHLLRPTMHTLSSSQVCHHPLKKLHSAGRTSSYYYLFDMNLFLVLMARGGIECHYQKGNLATFDIKHGIDWKRCGLTLDYAINQKKPYIIEVGIQSFCIHIVVHYYHKAGSRGHAVGAEDAV
ncbi:hypothetical protein SDJN03_17893, partial [Cucurbita argyrosperma subsp. sororia]